MIHVTYVKRTPLLADLLSYCQSAFTGSAPGRTSQLLRLRMLPADGIHSLAASGSATLPVLRLCSDLACITHTPILCKKEDFVKKQFRHTKMIVSTLPQIRPRFCCSSSHFSVMDIALHTISLKHTFVSFVIFLSSPASRSVISTPSRPRASSSVHRPKSISVSSAIGRTPSESSVSLT